MTTNDNVLFFLSYLLKSVFIRQLHNVFTVKQNNCDKYVDLRIGQKKQYEKQNDIKHI